MDNSKGKAKGFQDRRFQRIHLHWDQSEAESLFGVKAQVHPAGPWLRVFDMGLAGLALERLSSSDQKWTKGQQVQVHLLLPGAERALICLAEVVWVGEKSFGLRFLELGAEDRMALNLYLADQLIGASLNKVDPQYFSPDLDCQFWYHGPKDTNVFLWTKETKTEGNHYLIERADIQLDEDWFFYDQGRFSIVLKGETKTEIEAQGHPLLMRVVHLLSQVPQQRGPLKALLEELTRVAGH